MDGKRNISSTIRSIRYDVTKQELEIQFCYSGAYRYRNVPQEVYEELKKTTTPDLFVERAIRSRYKAVKMLTV